MHEAIMADARESFIRKLGLADLAILKVELRRKLYPSGLPSELELCNSVAPVDVSTKPAPGVVR